MTAADNLMHGPARLYVAPVGTTLPTIADVAALAAGTFAGFEDLGHTQGATNFRPGYQFKEVRSDQAANPLATLITGADARVSTTLLEQTLDNLKVALSATRTDGLSDTDFAPSGIGQAPGFALALVGPVPGGTGLLVVAHGKVVSETEIGFTRENETVVAVEVQVHESDALASGWKFTTNTVESGS